jgi:ketosteroid isomerase-like protein
MKFFSIAFIILSSCSARPKDISKQATAEIIEADNAMSEMATKEGFNKTLLQYADEDVIKPAEGELPIVGKTALQQAWAGKKDNSSITWQPVRALASASGDMGYTFGIWKYAAKDTIMYGNYCTVWKKQADGKWKFIFDGGNNTPKP